MHGDDILHDTVQTTFVYHVFDVRRLLVSTAQFLLIGFGDDYCVLKRHNDNNKERNLKSFSFIALQTANFIGNGIFQNRP